MFTIYIHILEVLAMNKDGASVPMIVDMGPEWTMALVTKRIKELENEGYVQRDERTSGIWWTITDKAIEYCETVTRKYDNARKTYEQSDANFIVNGAYVYSVDIDGVPDHVYIGLADDTGAPPPDAIVLNDTKIVHETRVTIENAHGEKHTISAVFDPEKRDAFFEALEHILPPPPPPHDDSFDDPICDDCGGYMSYHEDHCPHNIP